MDSRVFLVAIACVTGVAMLGIITESDHGQRLGATESAGPEEMLVRYDKGEVERYPRPPLPRTSPGGWIASEDYPSVALHNEFEGRLTLSVTVDPYGEVADCEITRSSGIPAFDRRACNTISTRARFFPALDERQEPVRGIFNTTVVWQFNDSDAVDVREIIATVDGNGTIPPCRWASADHPKGDPMPVCVGEGEARLARGGQPVYGQVPMAVTWEEARRYLGEANTGR
jgi:TonB family protein